jgi:hypothetical protein
MQAFQSLKRWEYLGDRGLDERIVENYPKWKTEQKYGLISDGSE